MKTSNNWLKQPPLKMWPERAMETYNVLTTGQDKGKRLDLFLADLCGISRSMAQKWISEGCISVNGQQVSKSYQIEINDQLIVEVPPLKNMEAFPQDIPLDIVYEDAHLVVVNKPKGMVVHPAAGNPDGTLVNALLYHCREGLSGIGGTIRPGIVHRIDKDTSGLLVVAKDDDTHQGLAVQFAEHSIERVYHAVVYGNLKKEAGEIDAPIGRSRTDRKKMAVTQTNSKPAVTRYQVVTRYPGFTHLVLRLQTGRTHQIRVHMANLGHPLAGDAVYGPRKIITELEGQCLHAKTLGFKHPFTNQHLDFDSALPLYFTDFLSKL